MANNYLQFSEPVPHLTQEEERWLQRALQEVTLPLASEDYDASGKEVPREWRGLRGLVGCPDYDSDLGDCGFQWEFCDSDVKEYGRYLWLYADEHGIPEAAAYFVQQFLKANRPDMYWWLTYSQTCSSPRFAENGGGAVIATAEEIVAVNSHTWLSEKLSSDEYRVLEACK